VGVKIPTILFQKGSDMPTIKELLDEQARLNKQLAPTNPVDRITALEQNASQGVTVASGSLPADGDSSAVYFTEAGVKYFSAISGSYVAITAAPPVPLAIGAEKPEITGVKALGEVLSCSVGGWQFKPTSYTYQWKRDNVNIAGATASTHEIVAGDSDKDITCAVIGSNLVGAGIAAVSDAFVLPVL